MKQVTTKNLIVVAIHLLLLVYAVATGTARACEGADLERTNQLSEHMIFVNRTCNEAGTVQDSINCLDEEYEYMVQHMSKLPLSCQEMLKDFEPPQAEE
jgi:hypothetical protein